MSKFIDMLEKVGLQLPTPMGFGTASRREDQPPAIMLVGQVASGELAKNPGLADARVDAILVSLSSWDDGEFSGISNALEGRLWGLRVTGGVTRDQAKQAKDRGCDFIVFDADNTAAAVLNDDDLGKVIAVAPGLDENVARAIRGLSVDGAIFSPGVDLLPLTVQKMIDIQLVHGLMGNPFVMSAPSQLDLAELEAFRNAEITGLLVELSALDAVANTKDAIASLPRRKPRPKSRGDIIPLVPSAPAPARPGHEEEEEDDSWLAPDSQTVDEKLR